MTRPHLSPRAVRAGMFHEIVADPGELGPDELYERYESELVGIVEAHGVERAAAESGVDEATLRALVEGESPDLDHTEAAALLALDGDVDAETAVELDRDALLMGMTNAVLDVEALAAEADDHDVHLVPAFSGLGAPHWDERARGTVVGMSRDTGPEELASATLWGVAHRVREVVDAMAADAGAAVDVLRVDGGAAGNDGLCRRQADLLGTPVERPAVTETTALGAACAAGLSVGVWADRSELREHRRVERRFDPGEERAAERRHERWSAALERSRGWADED